MSPHLHIETYFKMFQYKPKNKWIKIYETKNKPHWHIETYFKIDFLLKIDPRDINASDADEGVAKNESPNKSFVEACIDMSK